MRIKLLERPKFSLKNFIVCFAIVVLHLFCAFEFWQSVASGRPLEEDGGLIEVVRNEAAQEDGGLVEFVRSEAAQMEIFPVEYVLYDRILFDKRWDLTFERYKSFYRFKERVCAATPSEIDACVATIDELSAKEKALVLAAIYIFEKARRPRPSSFKTQVIPDDERLSYFPYHSIKFLKMRNWELFLNYRPDRSIATQTWNRWNRCAQKYRDSSEVAFPALEADEEARKDEWKKNIDSCVELMRSKLDPTLRWEEWKEADSTKSDTERGRDLSTSERLPAMVDEPLFQDDLLTRVFLESVDSLEKSSPDSEDVKELVILREYWFATRSKRPSSLNSAGFPPKDFPNLPQTLGEITDKLIETRICY